MSPNKKKAGAKKGRNVGRVLIVLIVIALVAVVLASSLGNGGPAVEYEVEIVAKLRHDPKAFTQGLLYEDGFFYESTGLRGESTLRKVRAENGRVLQRHDLAAAYFAEGLALMDDKLYQLTYQENTLFVYDAGNLRQLDALRYEGEGWGLTHDGEHLIMSNGSDVLSFRDPERFRQTHTVRVRENGREVSQLNELEYIDGEIWANIWRSKRIVRIDPGTGHVTGRIDLRAIPPRADRTGDEDYLNGIAYDRDGGRIFVTGKRYAFVYQIQLREKTY